VSPYMQSVLMFAGINIILAISWYVPHCAGLISLGQGGFMAIGAYIAALLTLNHVPFYLSLLAGAISSCIVSIIVGLPALRIKGLYLILLTIGFGEIVRIFFLNFEPTGAAEGLGGMFPYTNLTNVYLTVIIIIFFINRINKSRFGRAMEAVLEDEDAAETLGVNLTSIKLLAFGTGGFLAGLGGGFYAHYALYVDSNDFGILCSVEILTYPLLGGVSSLWGGVLGALVLTYLTEALRVARDFRMEIFGSIIVLTMIFRPQGLLTKQTVSWKNVEKIFRFFKKESRLPQVFEED
jgi:branched-chain amino acid transport system permease protein